jgi:FAD/FMN-containing dehydrogenase
MGAGVQGFEAGEMADKFGFRVIDYYSELVYYSESCPTVGIAGGYLMGGGHSQLAGQYGLAADNVLAWEVVITQGDHIVASPILNPDLFWALTGGGPYYAIVVSVTVKLHHDGPIGNAHLSFNASAVGADVFWDTVGQWTQLYPPRSWIMGTHSPIS